MFVKIKDYYYNLGNCFIMRYIFYSLLFLLLLIITFKYDKKIRKDQYCKEGLFFQMLLNKCTPRDFLYDKNLQKDI